jgi:TRAP-type C4-dicarboxylate transport system permease small subunit
VALHWTEEVASISMVWAVYTGASLCVRERFHIRILVAVQSLPTRIGRITIFIADGFWAFFCLFMIKVCWEYLGVLWKYTTLSPSLGINQFYPQSILVIGYALMLLRLIQTYLQWWNDGAEGLPGMLDETGDAPLDEVEAHL